MRRCPACCSREDTAGKAVLRRGRLPAVRPDHRAAGILPDAHRAGAADRGRTARGRRVSGPAVLVEYGASDEAKAEYLLRGTLGVPRLCADRRGGAAARADARAAARAAAGTVGVRRAGGLHGCGGAADAGARAAAARFLPWIDDRQSRSAEARRFLQRARAALGDQSSFLVGVDLRKDPAILLPAYDDSQGVTAAFNRNLLVRLNREAGADFDLSCVRPSRRVERRSEPDRDAPGEPARPDRSASPARRSGLPRGETIHTENSYKYAPERFAALADAAGWHSAELWTDPARLFSLHLLEQRRGP